MIDLYISRSKTVFPTGLAHSAAHPVVAVGSWSDPGYHSELW